MLNIATAYDMLCCIRDLVAGRRKSVSGLGLQISVAGASGPVISHLSVPVNHPGTLFYLLSFSSLVCRRSFLNGGRRPLSNPCLTGAAVSGACAADAGQDTFEIRRTARCRDAGSRRVRVRQGCQLRPASARAH